MKATIVYQSQRGKTAGYAREMAMYLWQKGMNVSLCATSDFKAEKLEHCDCLILGCWTSGWFIVNQHPNKIWTDFAEKYLQGKLPPHLILFTTYKFHTGSMFNRMKKKLNLEGIEKIETLKSKTGFLSTEDKSKLDKFIGNINNLK